MAFNHTSIICSFLLVSFSKSDFAEPLKCFLSSANNIRIDLYQAWYISFITIKHKAQYQLQEYPTCDCLSAGWTDIHYIKIAFNPILRTVPKSYMFCTDMFWSALWWCYHFIISMMTLVDGSDCITNDNRRSESCHYSHTSLVIETVYIDIYHNPNFPIIPF